MDINHSRKSNRLLVPGVNNVVNQMKYEIANEYGVDLGANTSSRINGAIGGEITKRLVATAQNQFGNAINNHMKR